jgi:hypothetical protein
MLVEMSTNIIWLVTLMSMVDISLTYYILWYDKKLNPTKASFRELNPIGATIMRLTKYGPWGLLIGAIFSQALIWACFWFEMWCLVPGEAIATQYLFCGAITVAIWLHITSIKDLNKINRERMAMVKQ